MNPSSLANPTNAKIPLFKVYMSEHIKEDLLSTIYSGYVGQGIKNKEFEDAISNYIKNKYCVTVSAGTHAIHLAYRLMGVSEGDEVITTPLTCFCANTPILNQKAKIVWADVNKDMNINSKSIESKITAKTKAIYVMHWGGYPCDMEEIYNIAQKHGLFLLEDAAHAFGATYKNTIIGDCSYSDYTIFSFQAIKHVSSVDGGALMCKYENDYNRAKLLRWYGIDRESELTVVRCEDDIIEWGYKYHMNDVLSVIGTHNLKQHKSLSLISDDNVLFYKKELSNINGIELIQNKDDRKSSNWLFTILVEKKNEFCKKMKDCGIAVSHVHARNDDKTCTAQFRSKLPMVDYVYNRHICIPCGWWVTKQDRQYIVDCIKEGW